MSASDLTDDLLMIRLQEDDEAAFDALFQRYQGDVHNFLQKRLVGALSGYVDDVAQRVWVEFYRRREQFTPGTHVRRLLYKIAEARRTDLLRWASKAKRDYRRNVPLGDVPDEAANPAHQENQVYAHELLASLPPKEAEALLLARLEGHSAQSAADKLGLTLDTVQWRVREALRRLRGDPGPETT